METIFNAATLQAFDLVFAHGDNSPAAMAGAMDAVRAFAAAPYSNNSGFDWDEDADGGSGSITIWIANAIRAAIKHAQFDALILLFNTMDETGRMEDDIGRYGSRPDRTWLQELLWLNPHLFTEASPYPVIMEAIVGRVSANALKWYLNHRKPPHDASATVVGSLIAAKACLDCYAPNDEGIAAQGVLWQTIHDSQPLPVVQELLAAKAHVGDRCLSQSIDSGRADITNLLLAHGCRVNEEAILSALDAPGESNMLQPLLAAASAYEATDYMRLVHYGVIRVVDDVQHVQVLLDTKVDLLTVAVPRNSPRGFMGQHSLLGQKLDAQKPNAPATPTVIQLLISAKIDINPVEEDVMTAAVQTNNPTVFDLLIAAKARVNVSICQSALQQAAALQHTSAARWLVREGCGRHLRHLGPNTYRQAIRAAINAWLEQRGGLPPKAAAYFPLPTDHNANERMEYVVNVLSIAEVKHSHIRQLFRGMQPFARRPHTRNDGSDIRDDVWRAAAPVLQSDPYTPDAVDAIIALGIDVTKAALQNEITRVQQRAGPFGNKVTGHYFFKLWDNAKHVWDASLVWPPNTEVFAQNANDDKDDSDVGQRRRTQRVLSTMQLHAFLNGHGQPPSGA